MSASARFRQFLFGRQSESWKDTAVTVVKYGCLAYVVRTYGVGATFVSCAQLRICHVSRSASNANFLSFMTDVTAATCCNSNLKNRKLCLTWLLPLTCSAWVQACSQLSTRTATSCCMNISLHTQTRSKKVSSLPGELCFTLAFRHGTY